MALDIGSRIVELRGTADLSQEGLANELGLSRQAVSRWERGEALPDTENLIALADLFGVTLDELVRPKAAVETDDEVASGNEAEAEEPEMPDEFDPESEASDAPEATPEPEATPGPEATIPPPRPVWMKALLLVAALASLALSALFVANVVTYAYHTIFPSPSEEYVAPPVIVDGSQVTSIDVMWRAGEVEVVPTVDDENGGDVLIQAFGADPTWKLENGRLQVTCDHEEDYGEVTIFVMVPPDVALNLQELSLEASDGASGFFSSIACDKIYVYESNGFVQVDNCEAAELDIRATAGTVLLAGSFEHMAIDAKSTAEVNYAADTTQEMPKALDVRLSESSLNLTVPKSAGLTLTDKGDAHYFDTNLSLVYGEDGAVYGTGETKVSVEADANSHVSIMGDE